MTAVPTVPVFATGVLPTSQLNQLGDALNFALGKPVLRCRQIVSQNITTGGSLQPVTFTTEDYDSTGAMHDNAINPSRATAVYPGWYRAAGGLCWPANATGQRVLGWAVNGNSVNGADTSIQGFAGLSNRQAARPILVFLAAGDYLELMAFQNSGSTLATDVTTTAQGSLDIAWERS